jgi:major membrane immunogen (membrane-anchored lipoprotein)
MMKKTVMIAMALMLMVGIMAGCGNNNEAANNEVQNNTPVNEAKPADDTPAAPVVPAETGLTDGLYYAEGEFADNGWKEIVALKVEGGKIVSANWNGLHKDGGLDKKMFSEKGYYGMKAKGASSEWHEQAIATEKYLLENQDFSAITLGDDGKTDAIAGVSIHINGFTELSEKALAAGPVAAGPYKDGNYYAEAAEFDANSGWKETVDITVINGRIASASWNGVHKDGGTNKITRSKDGEYGMKAKGASSEWHEQAALTESYLLDKQDPAAIAFNAADGKTDAIAGVSIHVNSFVELAIKALEGAK